jgi:hypothetical protein
MKIKGITKFLALWLAATFVGLSEEIPNGEKIPFPKWAFCVAYQVRDADERDARPVDPTVKKEDPLDPFSDEDTWIPHEFINDRHIVDVPALSTRSVKSGVLKHQAAEKIIQATTRGEREGSVIHFVSETSGFWQRRPGKAEKSRSAVHRVWTR